MGLLNWAKNKSARMVGYERIKEDSKLIYEAGKILSGKGEPDAQEKMQKLDKATLDAKKKNYVFFAKLGLAAFLIIIAFMIYKIFKHEFFGALCIFVVALIPLIQAFKYHYWYTILKEKKLLTVKDYFDKFRTEIK
jgi:hypothetical protein